MKYINGTDILPEELMNEIRKYTEGVYIYISKSEIKRNKWGDDTNHRREMELRIGFWILDEFLQNCILPLENARKQ